VTLLANSFAGALYKNKFKSSETPTRTGTVSVNWSVYWRSNDDRTWKKSSDLGEISAVTVRLGVRKLLTDC